MSSFRADRIATLYFFHPLRRLLRRTASGIPILMYHSISDTAETRASAYFKIRTTPRIFREHLSQLARAGYATIGLADAARRLQASSGTAGKLVALTFDDGYQDFYSAAFPILQEFQCTATVFLPTASICRTFQGAPCLAWSQIRELLRHGIEFGSHTVTHPQLRTLPEREIQRELQASRQEIEDRLGNPAASFSYPYAFPEADAAFRRKLRAMLLQAGYENGVSTIVGTASAASDRLFLERLPINAADDEALFTAKLQGGYDWLHAVQFASKLRTARAAGAQ
jgi:peptidoglycan/xylan/chitin deacetylase (PgdA/CDA1 family)